ncbi:hypothetical protein [Micromonospora coriariae]|uniref:hypothetical protein n=1 Tax=Micromonospora coriariae TaxID=285665 RepID=UPI0012FD92D2|nr:hypothetical protein [Micromonospora coriariae]
MQNGVMLELAAWAGWASVKPASDMASATATAGIRFDFMVFLSENVRLIQTLRSTHGT